MTSFDDFALPVAVRDELARQGLDSPFPIQVATLPDTLAGRDVLGRGRTGSGKTLAFALPLVTRLAASSTKQAVRRPRGLVLCPTRELAQQIDATVAPIARAAGLVTTVIYGGVTPKRQISALNGGVDIVIACPGRLEDLLKQKALALDTIEVTVLDEADHMAELGFLPGVRRLLNKTPRGGQRMMFSATLDGDVDQLVDRYLVRPAVHSVDSARSPVGAMTHHVFAVEPAEKSAVVARLASGTGRRVLFTRTRVQAKNLAKILTAQGIPAVELHGDLAQNARERNLAAFTSGIVRVLVATDVAARGIHVDEVELVVHIDPPAEHKSYLHRSGRTARAGRGGDVVTIMLPEQAGEVRDLMRLAQIKAKPQKVVAGDVAVTRLVGEVAPYVRPSKTTGAGQALRSARAVGQRGARDPELPVGHAAREDSGTRGEGTTQGRGASTDGAASRKAPAPQRGATAKGNAAKGKAAKGDAAKGKAAKGKPGAGRPRRPTS